MYINMYGSANYGYDATTYAALEQLGIARNEITSTAHPVLASVFFVSFILTGAMIVLNLFVGVMLTGMDDARKKPNCRSRQREKPPRTQTSNKNSFRWKNNSKK